jgi:hypothetical protein
MGVRVQRHGAGLGGGGDREKEEKRCEEVWRRKSLVGKGGISFEQTQTPGAMNCATTRSTQRQGSQWRQRCCRCGSRRRCRTS